MTVYISKGECGPVDDNRVNPLPLGHVKMKLMTRCLLLQDEVEAYKLVLTVGLRQGEARVLIQV